MYKNSSVTGKVYTTLEDLLIDNIEVSEKESKIMGKPLRYLKEQKVSLLKRSTEILPNLVIKIPDWVNPIIEEIGSENLEYKVVGVEGESKSPFLKTINQGIILSDEIPIQVKESEKLIPLKNNSYRTIWGDNFIEDHFPSLKDCEDFDINSYIVFSDDRYNYVDRLSLNKDLLTGKICGIKLMSNITDKSNCPQKIYERDCVREKNVIEGIKMVNNSVFKGINNQPGGEDVITLHYIFVASGMCGNLNVSQNCPPEQWKFVFMGNIHDFYTIQVLRGHPKQTELKDVILIRNGYYVKSFPKYYNIPVDMSLEGIYSQAAYLIKTRNSTWDGNVYGDNVSFSVYEHDDIIVGASGSQTITINNVTKVSAKLKIGEVFQGGADFENGITRTSQYSYTINSSKDVELGQNASVYFDENHRRNGKIYGINKSTGSIITHFAYYY